MKSLRYFLLIIFIILVSNHLNAQTVDAEGCKDHPIFNRMPNFHIGKCIEKNLDGYDFFIGNYSLDNGEKVTERIEGSYFEIEYLYNSFNATSGGTPALEIMRYFENSLKKLGAKILSSDFEETPKLVAKIVNDKMETWFELKDCANGKYSFVTVQRPVENKGIQANEIYEALNKKGYVALNILFDTGKATIKQESQTIVDEVYTMLNKNATMKASIEGHTDNTGNASSNKKLSELRAKAVMDALIAKGIKKERLTSRGWGQEKPIADNKTDEGRGKNRRVEIVKK